MKKYFFLPLAVVLGALTFTACSDDDDDDNNTGNNSESTIVNDARFKDKSFLQKEVTMGIRPEDIDDNPEFVAAHPDSTIKVHVEVTELMGAETYLYFSTSGKENKEDNVIARVDPRTVTRTGDDTKVALDTSRLHFFEKDTKNEETILNRK
jgi:multiple sugar transport system ATP-binding protein